jgi:multicomponent K+:H+ antiporter subunit E
MKRVGNWLPHPLLTPVLVRSGCCSTTASRRGRSCSACCWAGIPRFTLAFWPQRVRIRRPARLLHFTGVFLYDVIIANFAVARLVLAGRAGCARPLSWCRSTCRRARHQPAGQCHLPDAGHRLGGLSADRHQLLVHALDCSDPEALVATIKARFEAPLKEIFEC